MTSTPAPELTSPIVMIDPTMLALLGIFGGAALTAIAGLIGWVLQGRREHKRWLRDQRRDLFVDVLAVIEHMIPLSSRITALQGEIPGLLSDQSEGAANRIAKAREELHDMVARVGDLVKQLDGLRAPMNILASKSSTAALESNVQDLTSGDLDKARASKAAIVAAMRKDLGVRD